MNLTDALPQSIEDAIHRLVLAKEDHRTFEAFASPSIRALRAAVMAEIGAAQERGIAQMKDAMRRAVEDATARAEKAEAMVEEARAAAFAEIIVIEEPTP